MLAAAGKTHKPPPLERPNMSTTLTVEGMSCDGCERSVTDALESVAGVEGAEADRESDTATVRGDADVDELVAAVEEAGYQARPASSA